MGHYEIKPHIYEKFIEGNKMYTASLHARKWIRVFTLSF